MGTIAETLSKLELKEFVESLAKGGWIQIIFPFLLIYAIIFTASKKIKLFEDKKGVRVLISFVIAFFAITFPVGDGYTCNSPLKDLEFARSYNYNYANSGQGCTVGDYMSMLFPGVSIFAISILGLYIVCGMLGIDLTEFVGGTRNSTLLWILGSIGFLMVGAYFLQAFGFINTDDSNDLVHFFWNSDDSCGDDCGILKDPLLWMLIIFVFLFKFMSDDDDDPEIKAAREAAKQKKKADRAAALSG
jgi:hypothetical protein